MMVKISRILLYFIALIAVATGSIDIVVGAVAQRVIGVDQSVLALRDPVLDSQIRFLGSIWCGFGCLIIYCLNDFYNRLRLLQWAMSFLIVGGVGRAASAFILGFPSSTMGFNFVIFALAIELLCAPFVLYVITK
jgi:hypothetical protein